jgi:16S rRNA (cytosine1402-N4)-methyltransferase
VTSLTFAHVPVLLAEAVKLLNIKKDGIYVDCTLGGGGHSGEILKHLGERGRLFSFDQDEYAIANAKEKFAGAANIFLIHDNFANLGPRLLNYGVESVDGIVYDLGVSSPQLDMGERGFSYQQDAPLDMRMNKDNSLTARQAVNQLAEEELAKIFWEYGEERWAKRVAQFLVEHRSAKLVETTAELVTIIKKAIPKGARKEGPHPAKRIFQALRIYVNNELGNLKDSLEQSVDLLKPAGRLSIITFHSLEDRIVKQFIKEKALGCICPRMMPICICGQKPVVKNLTKKPVEPTPEELTNNPRARSAKLRGCEKN